jgi:hypothetical protein
MSLDRRKVLMAVGMISILVISGIIFFSTRDGTVGERSKESPSMEWVDRLNRATSVRKPYLDDRIAVMDMNMEESFISSISLSSVSVSRKGNEMEIDPVILSDGDDDSLNRFESISTREPLDVIGSDPGDFTVGLASQCFKASDFIILYSTYTGGLKGASLASYYGIPLVFSDGPSQKVDDLIDELGVKYAISIDDAPLASVPTMALGTTEPCHNGFFLWCLESRGDSTDYMVITNPEDINNDWGEQGHLPVRGLSAASVQLAAYRKALMFFVEGYNLSEIGVDFDDKVNFNQMGASVAIANNYSDAVKGKVLHALEEADSSSAFDLKYIGIVGDPIAVPHHYEDFGDGSDGTTFSNTNFIASDYFFADTEGDEKQDLAYGRIMGRSLTDTTLLNARTLDFEEYSDYQFERGNDIDQRIYDTLSPDWKNNAGVFVGTSKPFPMPGALKHMKKYQYDVLGDGGMFVTTEESMKLNDITADMTLDKMNYMMYCGHGLQSSWYSNRVDNIDSRFISTQKLKPGFTAVMACLTGRVDNLDDSQEDKISLSFIHAGLNGYIGSTRLAYGLFKIGQGDQGLIMDTGALYLVDRISLNYVKGGMTIGELLMESRNEMIEYWGIDGSSNESYEASIAMWEYILYGDPAWTPA